MIRSLFALVLVAAVGCAAPPSRNEASASAAEIAPSAAPILSFAADWSVTQSAPLHAGQAAVLRYAVQRLPRCRATYNGLPAWAIQASWNADGGFASNGAIYPNTPVEGGLADVAFTVPVGHELSVWFFNSDEYGCNEWDSNYGTNFRFAIQPADAALHFQRDFHVTTDGVLRGGETVTIDYDLERLPTCRQDYNGLATWDVSAHFRTDGGSIHDVSLTAVSGSQRVPAPATIALPASAHELELWFDNVDRTGCHQWDSDYGTNFHFPIQ